jgi:hypothetical protein
MNLVDELRDIDGVKGAIAVSDYYYPRGGNQHLLQLIYSNVKEVVE